MHKALPLLRGKRLLVTGAASGIGLGAVRLFKAAGAEVVASDLDEIALNASAGAIEGVYCVGLDVTREDDCRSAVAFTRQRLGGIDGLFNSAGISDVVTTAAEIDIEAWQRVVDVNLRGSFLIARTVGRELLAQRSGSIVLISSINGLGGIPRRHAYGPAKAAIAQLTRTLACEWGASNVRVNAIAPTYIRTPMIDRLASEGKIDIGRLERRTPLARIGEVDDVGRAAAYLLSDWSDYVTGTILPVDGGWLAYGGPGDVATA